MVRNEQQEFNELIQLSKADCENDFKLFCRFFLYKRFDVDSAKFHEDLFDICMDDKIKRAVIAAPREHAKSTIMSFAFPLWILCYSKYKSVLIISATNEFATKLVGHIKRELENNPLLRAAFGSLKSDKWTENYIITSNGVELESKGRGQQLRGNHYKCVVCDDLEDDEELRSETQVEIYRDWFDGVLYNTVGFEDRIFYIGTMLAENCFIKVLFNRKNWQKWFYQAYIDGVEKVGNELWAAKHPHIALQDKKTNNPYRFATEQMNNPLLASEKRIKSEWFQYYDNLPENLNLVVTVAVDPSGMASTRRGDKCGISVVGTSREGSVYSLEAISRALDPQELTLELFRINKQYAPHKIGIEANANQRILKFYINEKIKSGGGFFKVEEFKTSTTMSKNERIYGLIPFFAEGKIFLKRNQYDLIQQLKAFPIAQEHDDIMDALAYQLQLIQFPGQEAMLTPEEIQRRINTALNNQIFSMPRKEHEGSVTGYRANFSLGD